MIKCPVMLCCDYRVRYRTPIVHENELYCSPRATDKAGEIRAPLGEYDVAEYLKSLPALWKEPSLLLVSHDHLYQSVPRNFSAVKCPKIVFLGDTHHGEAPLLRTLQYLMAERFDLVILEY